MISVNALVQEAAEECSMVGDQEPLDGSTAASFLKLLNRVMAQLNNDSYFSSCQDMVDVEGSSHIFFKQLAQGEAVPDGVTVVDMEPPESLVGVSRKVGIRFLQLEPGEPSALSAMTSMALPTHYTYGVTSEPDGQGGIRLVGDLWLDGQARSCLRIFMNRRIPELKLTDSIPMSPIYHDAILYSLAYAACIKYKLKDYLDDIRDEKNAALAVIDRNTLNNRAMENGTNLYSSYDQPYYDGLAGNGLQI